MKSTMVGLMLFLMTVLVWAGTFKDDFNDGNDDGWEHWGNGKWKVQEGQYIITSLFFVTQSLWGDVKWADYTVEVRARLIKGEWVSLVIRSQEDKINSYAWSLNVPDNAITWWIDINGNWTEQTRDVVKGNSREEHSYKIVVSGNQFKGYYDGKLIREWQDMRYKTGRVGISICCDGAEVIYDDFVVTGTSVPDSGFAVASQDKLATAWATIKQGR